MASISNFDDYGNKLWDVAKFPYTNSVNAGGTIVPIVIDDNTIMDGLRCSDCSVDGLGKTFIVSKNNKIVEIEVQKITSVDKQGIIMIINTEDEVPTYLSFINEHEQTQVENRLYTIMNGANDPGCAGSGLDVNIEFDNSFNSNEFF